MGAAFLADQKLIKDTFVIPGRAHQKEQRLSRARGQTLFSSSKRATARNCKPLTCRAVAETDKEAQQAPAPVQEGTWHAVIANADFMLHDVQNESFAEQLRERRRLFNEKGKPLDFWIVADPIWLDESFPKEAKQVKRPSVALVSTDEIWMNFMKLRLDRVLRLELGQRSLEDVTKSAGSLPDYKPLDRDVKWTAPYPPYRPGWWEIFMRK